MSIASELLFLPPVFSHSNSSFVVVKDMSFLLTYYLDPHRPNSLLCQPKLSISGPQECYSFHYPGLQPGWFIPCVPKKLWSWSLSFCLKSPSLPIQALPAFLIKFLFLVLKTFFIMPFPVNFIYNFYIPAIHCIALFYNLTHVHICICPWEHVPLLTVSLVDPTLPSIMTSQMVGILKILGIDITSSPNYSVSFFKSIQQHFLVLMHCV